METFRSASGAPNRWTGMESDLEDKQWMPRTAKEALYSEFKEKQPGGVNWGVT